jgi:hypothetical protein
MGRLGILVFFYLDEIPLGSLASSTLQKREHGARREEWNQVITLTIIIITIIIREKKGPRPKNNNNNNNKRNPAHVLVYRLLRAQTFFLYLLFYDFPVI